GARGELDERAGVVLDGLAEEPLLDAEVEGHEEDVVPLERRHGLAEEADEELLLALVLAHAHARLQQERGAAAYAGAVEPAEAEPVLGEEEGEAAARSEEHTSELQSRENLVCRLLLEKKK